MKIGQGRIDLPNHSNRARARLLADQEGDRWDTVAANLIVSRCPSLHNLGDRSEQHRLAASSCNRQGTDIFDGSQARVTADEVLARTTLHISGYGAHVVPFQKQRDVTDGEPTPR